MKKLFTLTITLLASIFVFGQNTPPKNPIDIQLEYCLSVDSNQTTAGMIACQDVAAQAWDKELNKYYNLLMGLLNADEKQKLKAAQIAWLKYRDQEVIFANNIYGNLQGTMYTVIAVGRATDIIKQRAIELQEYYDLEKGGK